MQFGEMEGPSQVPNNLQLSYGGGEVKTSNCKAKLMLEGLCKM